MFLCRLLLCCVGGMALHCGILPAAEFFVLLGCFCAAVSCFVPQQCDWCHGICALCHGVARCATALRHVLFFVLMCHGIVLCTVFLCRCIVIGAMAVFLWHGIARCAAALCDLLQRCFLCHGIVLHAVALFLVPQHCVMCHGIVPCAAVTCGVVQVARRVRHAKALFLWQHCYLCCRAFVFMLGIVPCAMVLYFMPWHCGW